MSAVRFDKLTHRTTLAAELVAETAFRIGAGRSMDAATTDLPVLRAGGDRLIVPGSSLKGVFRGASEQLLRAVAPPGQEKAYACDLFGEACWEISPETKDAHDKLSVAARVEATRKLMSAQMCRACTTFGAQGWAAVARFTDAPVQGATTAVRDGVGLDRDLGRAADGIKYDYEVIQPGARVFLKVSLENAHDWQVGLLLAVLDQINDGAIRIGGFGSRGLGWFSVHDPKVLKRDLSAILAGDPGANKDLKLYQSAVSAELSPGGA